jgi:DNA repair protein REV1
MCSTIQINGYTQPSVQALRELIVKHGGIFQPYLDTKALVYVVSPTTTTPSSTNIILTSERISSHAP